MVHRELQKLEKLGEREQLEEFGREEAFDRG